VVEQPVAEEQSPNLICILPGLDEGTIAVGASLDYAAEDAKTPARWSALVLLPLLAKSLAGVPHRSTLVLIAFSGHAYGMRGATQYVNQLTEVKRRTLRAMVDLDDLGRTPPVYALAQTDKALAPWLEQAAHSLHLAVPPLVDASKSSTQDGATAFKDEDLWGDSQPFVQAHIPTINLRSAPPAALAALRREGSIPERVTGSGFDLDTYDDTYRLLCIYVLYLDGNLGRPPIRLGTYSGTLLDTAGHFGARTIEMSVELGRFSTAAELDRFEAILKKGGQEALADALESSNDVGSYRVGLRLSTGTKLAVLQTSGKTPSVLVVAVRLKRVGYSDTLSDYRFDVVQLNVDSKGEGDATYIDSAKLRFNSKHELEIEDRRYMPDEVREVRYQPPAAKTPPKGN
jgi:hypothetical protein